MITEHQRILRITSLATEELMDIYNLKKILHSINPKHTYDAVDTEGNICEIKVTQNIIFFHKLISSPLQALTYLQRKNIKKLNYIYLGYCDGMGNLLETHIHYLNNGILVKKCKDIFDKDGFAYIKRGYAE